MNRCVTAQQIQSQKGVNGRGNLSAFVMMKKTISVILCLCLLACSLGCLPVSAQTMNNTVKLAQDTYVLTKGTSRPVGTAALPAGVKANNLEWKSSDPKVVRVNQNGVITAVSAGTATVTCSVEKNMPVKAVDQCVIKVNDGKTDVSLNCYALKWPVGKTGSYKAKISSNVLGAKKITWTSSNTKIATIDANGKLKAVGPGAATVTCTVSAKSTGEKLASNTCKVEIYKPVSKVALNTYSIKWPVGRQGTYKPTVSPSDATNKSLAWSSSNTKVATVDKNGKLKAVGAGTVTITCTAKDGSGKKATCKVTVYQPVKSIKLNTSAISWNVGKSGTFKATVSPSNAANKSVSWKSSNTKVATVDKNGKLKAVGAGTATITCTAKDGNGAKATCKVTVKKSYTDDDLFCLAAVIYQEAGALYCSDKLQLMVGSVVMNHVAHPNFPNTIRGVITRPGAYGTMGWTGVSLPKANDSWTKQAIDRCYANAKKILEGTRYVPESVIYQAGFVQGSGIYDYREGMYFCYE